MGRFALVLSVAWLLQGCLTVKNSYEQDNVSFKPGSGGGGSTDTNTKAGRLAAIQGVFKAYNCATTGCHSPGNASNLSAVGVIDDQAWLDLVYLVPGDPAASYIYTKINHEGCTGGDCNMPSSSVKVSTEDMAIIADWITRFNDADPE